MAANDNGNERHYLVRLYHYIAGLFGDEPVLPNGPYENDELQPVFDLFPVDVDDPGEGYVGAADRLSRWNATEFLLVPAGKEALLLDDDRSFIYSWSRGRRVFECRTAETWLHPVLEPFERCIRQPGEIHHHPTVPYGWWELFMMDSRLRLLAAKRRIDDNGSALAKDVIQQYLSAVYSLEELPERRRPGFVTKILAKVRPRYKNCVRTMSMTRWHRVQSVVWRLDDRAALLGRNILVYLKSDHWEQDGDDLKVLPGYDVADYDDGGRRMEDGRWLVPHVVPASPPVAVRVHPPPVDDDDDDGADDDGGVGNESGRSNGPLARHRGAIDQQRRAAVEVRAVPPEPAPADGVDGNRSNDDLPLNQYAVVGGADRRVPRNNNFDPDEIIADIDRQDGAAAAAVVVGDDRVVGAGDDDEPQVEVYILPEDRIRYHLSMRSGVISSLPVGHEFHETHSLFTVVRTPNGAITPEDRVLIWASREEVQQLEEQRARKRARIE